jgi:hypothetical protein
MSPADQRSQEHQVGITNAQEQSPDAEMRRLTAEMNALFAAKRYAGEARFALSITALSKDELRQTFERHGVQVRYLDNQAFGTYAGVIEPRYDLRVEGATQIVLAAASELGKRHAQEAISCAQRTGARRTAACNEPRVMSSPAVSGRVAFARLHFPLMVSKSHFLSLRLKK